MDSDHIYIHQDVDGAVGSHWKPKSLHTDIGLKQTGLVSNSNAEIHT